MGHRGPGHQHRQWRKNRTSPESHRNQWKLQDDAVTNEKVADNTLSYTKLRVDLSTSRRFPSKQVRQKLAVSGALAPFFSSP